MAKLPLAGIRVADFSWVWAGPYCTLQLAYLGAEVIRIETKTRPCVTRMLPPWPDSTPGGLNRSGYFNQYNQGKKSLSLDFKHPEAKEVAWRLIKSADVVANNFAASVMTMDLLAEGILEYTMNGREPRRIGNRDPQMSPHGIFKCLDLPEKILNTTIDQWVAIVCADDEEWRRLARAIGRDELADNARFATLAARKRNENALEAIITEWTSKRHVADVVTVLQAAGVAAGACADNKYLAEDPNLAARKYWVELEHPEVGVRQHCGIPWRMSATPCEVKSPAPLLGQHTDELMTGLLGYTTAEVEELRKKGALD
jgi:crotonobetainyl-CoA:carnitine CoA-transferase CaiB-like acyl-CoA transferase